MRSLDYCNGGFYKQDRIIWKKSFSQSAPKMFRLQNIYAEKDYEEKNNTF